MRLGLVRLDRGQLDKLLILHVGRGLVHFLHVATVDEKRAWLKKVLMLPDDNHILGVSEHAFFSSHEIAVIVEAPEFKDHQAGERIPEAIPVCFKWSADEESHRWHGPAVEQVAPADGWGLWESWPEVIRTVQPAGPAPAEPAAAEAGAVEAATAGAGAESASESVSARSLPAAG